jgi:ATP-binding protein involved in chromosome partitioning
MIDEETATAALSALPATRDRVSSLRVAEGKVSLILDVTGLDQQERDALDQAVHRALEALPGVSDIRVAMTSARGGRRIIAVASGKGGVGKSTVSANIAIALARAGHKVGLIDADIYGPSQPRIMGAEGIKPMAEGQKLIPTQTAFGIPFLSMGQLVEPGQAIAWRGPMAGNALSQLVDANWANAEVLVVDMPPGTGDIQLQWCRIDLFVKAGVPIIGLVENMAGYACPHCNEISDPFGTGGAEAAAKSMGHAFLGRIPLSPAIRIASDAGTPPAAGEGEDSAYFAAIAARLSTWLENSQ